MNIIKKTLNFIKRLLYVIFIIVKNLLLLFIPIFISGIYQDYRFGSDLAFTASGNLGFFAMAVTLLFFAFIKMTRHVNKVRKKNQWEDEPWEIDGQAKRHRILLVSIVTLVAVSFVGINIRYKDYFTLDGVISSKVWTMKEYTWEDAESFYLDYDKRGRLMFCVHMKDGEEYSVNGGRWKGIEYQSTPFGELFKDGVYDYMPWLAVRLKETGVPMNTDNWDKLMRRWKYHSWKEYAMSVRLAYEGA